jgi:hypothetical protein
MQWGHGDDDYSAVARKYLPDTGSTAQEETKQPCRTRKPRRSSRPALEPTTSLAGLEEPRPSRRMAIVQLEMLRCRLRRAETKAQPRRGFLSQLLRRGRQLLKQLYQEG